MNSSLIIIVAVVVGAIVLLTTLLGFVNKYYIRVPPDKAAVVFGRKRMLTVKTPDGKEEKVEKGYRIVTGGGFFRIPIIEEVKWLDISNRTLNVKVVDAPNKDGVQTTVEGVANVKFASEIKLLGTAVERFLDKENGKINELILQNLEGHLRAVVGKMTMEALINDKTELNKAVLEEANDDFNKMGINIDFLNIQDIKDSVDYIKNLGRKRAAEIKRDAEIGQAEAERDSLVKTSTANRAGIEEANTNQIKIAESDKARDVRTAEMKALTDTQNEIANQAGPLSQAQAMKGVVEARANTEAAAEKAQIAVQEQRAIKESKKFNAEMIVPAEANKQAQIIKADAVKQSLILDAEGKREAARIVAEGEAKAVVLNKTAQAEGDAAIIIKKGEAEGKAKYAVLSAEAKGTAELADAYAKLDATGKFLEILKALQTLGPNMIREFAGVMSASTAHLGNVKDIKIIDFGSGKDGSSTTSKFGTVPVEVLTKMFEGLKGTGFDTTKLFNFLGIKPEDIIKTPDVSQNTSETTKSTKK